MAKVVFLRSWLRRFRRGKHRLAFTAIISGVLASTGVSSSSLSGIQIVSATFVASGSASDSSGGASTVSGAMTSAGVGLPSLSGSGVLTGSVTSTGSSSSSLIGAQIGAGAMTAVGSATALFDWPDQQIISTNMIQKPVDCVLIGDQVWEQGKNNLSPNLMKSIFRE